MSGVSNRVQDVYRRFSKSRWSVVLVIGALFAAIALLPKKPPQHSASVFSVSKRWAPFALPEVGIRAEMPEAPVLEHLRVPAGDTTLEAVAYSSSSGTNGYCLGYIDYPADAPLPKDEGEMIAKAYDWLGVDSDSGDTTVRLISHRSHDGVEIGRLLRVDDGSRLENRTRWFLAGQRGIIAGVTSEQGRFDEDGANRFFESLRFGEETRDPNP